MFKWFWTIFLLGTPVLWIRKYSSMFCFTWTNPSMNSGKFAKVYRNDACYDMVWGLSSWFLLVISSTSQGLFRGPCIEYSGCDSYFLFHERDLWCANQLRNGIWCACHQLTVSKAIFQMKSNWYFKRDLYVVTQLTYQLTCRLWPGWEWEYDMVISEEHGDDALLQNRTNHSRQRTAVKSHQTEFEGPVAFPYVLPLRVARRV